MNSFEAGFVKHAQEQGILFEEALVMLQKSASHPDLQVLLNSLPQDDNNDPEDLEKLSYLLELDNYDKIIQQETQNLYNL